MIHNPHVNQDLRDRGVDFLRTTEGKQLIPFESLTPEDIVIIPAFGTTLEVQQTLRNVGIDPQLWNTTCPFVEKVWKKSEQIARKDFSIIVHGKRYHEETRATFSHARQNAPVVVIRDLEEAELLGDVILGKRDRAFFFERFHDRYSEGFDPDRDLVRLGVVNQTTMLASETSAISAYLRGILALRYGEDQIQHHYADTSDTLCYATNENQTATQALINSGGDLALVVGGYNSSNTSHLVELCEQVMPSYFISSADEIVDPTLIYHFNYPAKKRIETAHWLPAHRPVQIILTAGASCPDALLEEVLLKVLSYFPDALPIEEALAPFSEPA